MAPGRRVSRGCIRLYPEDIIHLYDRVRVGTPVRVINDPIKTGWIATTEDRRVLTWTEDLGVRVLIDAPAEVTDAELLELAESRARQGDWQGFGEALAELRSLLERLESGGE